MPLNLEENIIDESFSIDEAIKLLNDLKLKLLFVVNSDDRLIGTLTDGDIRRATLKGTNFNEKISKIIQRDYIAFKKDTSPILVQKKLKEKNLLAIPILDSDGAIIDIHVAEELNLYNQIDTTAIIMAGGFGSRLGHLTENTPKPLNSTLSPSFNALATVLNKVSIIL